MSARIPYRLPVLPPELGTPAPDWRPKESFSPSALASYGGEDGCKRKWAWGAIFGVWGLKKSLANLLGSLIHGSIEHYLRGRTVYDLVGPNGELRLDRRTLAEFTEQIERGFLTRERLGELVKEAPIRALAGQEHLPNTRDPGVEVIEVERWIDIDTRKVISGVEPIKITGKLDLAMRRVGVWYLYDHKSTKGRRVKGAGFDPWAYAKSPEQLRKDPQAIFYALDLMLRHNLDALWIRWVYYLTETKEHPIAKPVDVELTRAEVMEAAFKWLCIANEMRGHIRAHAAGQFHPDDLEPNLQACDSYGGCSYHYSKGGPCMPGGEMQLGDLITAGRSPEKANQNMSVPQAGGLQALYANTVGGAAAVSAAQAAPPATPMPLVPPEAHTQLVAAPVPMQPPAPAGWEYGPTGQLRQQPPPGYQYSADGTQLLPIQAPPVVQQPPAPPAPMAAAVATTIAPPAGPGSGEAAPAPAESRRRGRPAGSKNKKGKDADPEFSLFDVVQGAVQANPGSPLASLTCAQLAALEDALFAEAPSAA